MTTKKFKYTNNIMSKIKEEDLLTRANLDYSEELYESYLKDPSQVGDSWRWFFQGLNTGLNKSSLSPLPVKTDSLENELKVFQMFQHYRDHGSLKARLNPLGDNPNKGFPKLEDFKITDEDLNRQFAISENLFGMKKPLKDVLAFLEEKYCHTLALQVGGCSPKVRQWFFNEFEKKDFLLSKQDKIRAFTELVKSTGFEKFLHFRFLGKKRFSLEGLDALIPMLDYLLEKGTSKEMKNLVIGMSHRGRINVLINIMKQNPKVIFSDFEESPNNLVFDLASFTRDVKYHTGFSSQRQTQNGPCSLYLGYNPSHLEAIGPVICGVSRAIQRKNKDTQRRKTAVPVLIHGDAAFCGQGSVSETMQLSKLKGYSTGGTIHIILNNQLGFTTDPEEGRSSLFASDLAKSIEAPVLLVNADDLHSCLKAMDMAFRFRYEFGMDIFIDLIGYRKHGHNEGDEPSFTQPLMYKKIKNHPSLMEQYKEQLLKENVLPLEEAENIIKQSDSEWEKQLMELRNKKEKLSEKDYIGQEDKILKKNLKSTKVEEQSLEEVLQLISNEPEGIHLHPKIKRILKKRREDLSNNKLDWAVCELSAYGTLIKDGFSVRLTGQDSKRGTFSHRHAVYYDYETRQTLSPLKQLAKSQQLEFCLYNSPLSEMAVLAFEYGNSCLAPDFLTLWEAQFGDFANGAQIVIDQFISSGEMKWLKTTDIVLLLPHGYEGQGPEHSSAYLERFLQLCAQNNMRVCNFTKASNLFHALRRQKTLLEERKPLIIMTPKSLLRHPEVQARKEDLIHGKFEEVIWDKEINEPRDVGTLILCSGKVYYDLKQELSKEENKLKKKKTAIFRLEQLYPFPSQALNPALNGFPCLSKIIWLQEEPENRGAWSFVKDHLEQLLKSLGQSLNIQYHGRAKMAASSEGSEKAHKVQQEKLIKNCISAI